jgi:hypothetical protein
MISCRQRRDTERPLTLASLDRVGIRPRVFESPCDPPSPRENRRVSLEALTWARGHDVLFFEDDVDADETLPAWLELARAQRQPVTFCLIRPAWHPPQIRRQLDEGRAITPGLYPVQRFASWYGTQAIYLPAGLVDFIVDHPAFMRQNMHRGEPTWTGFDLFLREHLKSSGYHLLAALPNPVEHRDPPKLVPRRTPLLPRRSLSYGSARRGPVPRVDTSELVDVLATSPHYLDHLRPIYELLPDRHRGDVLTSAAVPSSKRPTVVSSFGDLQLARRAGRPVILTEHGAGQSYRLPNGEHMRHTSLAGGRDRYGVILALVPGPAARDAYLETRTLNGAPIVEVGVPKLDAWHAGRRRPNLTSPPTIAVSFHWDCYVAPETRSSWRRFLPAIAQLARERSDVRILGHAHPRLRRTIEPVYAKEGIPFEPDFERVLELASVYVCDNSSTMYEYASTERPVVVLNHRLYRRGLEHGLRFWAGSALGPHVGEPNMLSRAIDAALRPTREDVEARRASVALAYHATDGNASERAVRAILDAVTG